MTTVGRWSPNKVRARVLDGTWVSTAEELGGMVLLTPTSIAYTGTSATVGANGSVEFTACSVLSLNGVFSADYDNYMVVIRQDISTGANAYYRLRASNVDDSTASSYVAQYFYASSTTLVASRTTRDKGAIGYVGGVQRSGLTLNIYGPYLAQPTAWRGVSADDYQEATIYDAAGTHNQSISYDGFTLLPSAGALDGLVSVYGIRGA